MKRQRQTSACPMDTLLRLLMGPWTTYVLWVLSSNGPTRFGELKRRVPGVSAKVLTDRLRMLVDAGIIFRRYEATIPPKVTYGLAARGEELREVLDGLNAVALRWQVADEAGGNGSGRPGPSRNGEDEHEHAGEELEHQMARGHHSSSRDSEGRTLAARSADHDD
jgi:DNA-binding HxlR family transcriptional regulator